MRTLLSFMADFLVPPVVNDIFPSSRNAFHANEMRTMTKEKISRTTNRQPNAECKNYQLWFLYSKAEREKIKLVTVQSSVAN